MPMKKKAIPLIIVFLLWVFYTIIYTIQLNDTLAAFLEFVPGILAIITLLVGGYTVHDLYLKPAPISLKGAILLTVFLLALIPVLLTGDWTGFQFLPFFVYAPASGIAQELFFRSSLLPLALKICKGKNSLAITIQSFLFTLWHVPLAFAQAPLPGAIAVIIVTFIGGIIWGWQVNHDKTVYWAMVQHVIYLMVMSLFLWG